MPDAQFVHGLFDEAMSFVAHEFLANAELGGAVAPVEAPVAEGEDDRQCLDAGLGEAVSSPCAACRVFAAQDAGSYELLEPGGQDVGCDAFDRIGVELAVVAAVTEDHVAPHKQRPVVAERFDCSRRLAVDVCALDT